jgi:hypothetical protein
MKSALIIGWMRRVDRAFQGHWLSAARAIWVLRHMRGVPFDKTKFRTLAERLPFHIDKTLEPDHCSYGQSGLMQRSEFGEI